LNVVQTALVFAGVPLAVVAIAVLAVYGSSDAGQRTNRYRPGRPWVYAPVWYLPRQIEADHGPSRAMAHELVEGKSVNPALPPAQPHQVHAVGGASGEW
jgi:hypothetical protein